MKIDFPNLTAPKITALGSVSFQVLVDEKYIWCEVSFDALLDHFCIGPMDDKNLLIGFEYGRSVIEKITRRNLERNGGQAILLMTDDFLPEDLLQLKK